ncbi:calcium-binding protein [Leptolyngbyaceae cyanobacterium CCMR0082]|uniref:Calcium-binding protein n=2 Tax=Adonisia turfae TaxID=2950184 RepID=A0A6M0S2P8_9CYAN|nr:calcium-binding protein [Adonisia turfae]MDV3351019.1 calcium-binding protein [Leptothoe sp. LEGE 181152]NEZ54561.1 calcium-binding protein [Adonisia turfae CCMR0081]NEZ62759.1 calcium-binding protein [Adonisia turfae CCMR0082]
MLTELQNRKLLKLFCMYDCDRDGFLVCKDFENIATKLAKVKNLGARSPKVLALKERFLQAWKSLLSGADSNSDKKISLQEWLTYYDDVLGNKDRYFKEVQSLMKLIFEVFDTNGDGQLCTEEWAELFQVYNVHPAYAPLAFEQLDMNGDGFLSKDEILVLIDDFFCGDDPTSVANSMFGPY